MDDGKKFHVPYFNPKFTKIPLDFMSKQRFNIADVVTVRSKSRTYHTNCAVRSYIKHSSWITNDSNS